MNRSLRILLAEDDAVDAALIQRACPAGASIDVAASVQAAIQHLEREGHDLYLYDYRLGAHDGLVLIQETRALGRDAPIIVMTGLDDERIGENALLAGATEFLPKSELSASIMKRLIRHALIRRHVELSQRAQGRDPVTQCMRRTEFIALIRNEMQRARRFDYALSLVLIDIDDFDQIHAEFGRSVSEDLLRRLAGLLRDSCRASDLDGRCGPGTLALLLPHTTAEQAAELCQRIMTGAASVPDSASRPALRVHCGCAQMDQHAHAQALLQSADDALFRARRQGTSPDEECDLASGSEPS